MNKNQQINFWIHLPPTLTCHTSFNLVNIQAIQEPLLTIFSVISKESLCGNITATISDHLPQFLVSPNTFANLPSNKSNIFERDWSKFDQESFIVNYFHIDWSNLLNLNEKNADLSTNNFLNAMNNFAPFKKIRKYKLKFKTKPWITFGIQNQSLLKKKTVEEIHQ